MVRIELGPDGLARARFAVSPLQAAVALLYHLRWDPGLIGEQWRAAAAEVLAARRLDLLAMVASGGPLGYLPEFLIPEPAEYEPSLDAQLHMVARTSIDRVGYEMRCVLNGRPGAPRPGGPASVQLASAVERGEQHFAGRVADELHQFCKSAITPRWPRLRAFMEEDISGRMDVAARHGYSVMISGLAATTRWRECGLDIDVAAPGPVSASAVIFAPCPFTGRPMHCIDPSDAPDYRAPLIAYPVISRSLAAPAPLDKLIGTTRARLLATLSTPRSTPELAELLYLSPSTVSYHLQILHRAGLARRIRRSRQVLYQVTQQAPTASESPESNSRRPPLVSESPDDRAGASLRRLDLPGR